MEPSMPDNPQSEIRNPQSPPPNPQSERRSAAAAANPQSQPSRRGRPRRLDEAKLREICALVAGGCGLREAARYVDCAVNTIRREAQRNPDFRHQLRRSEMYAQLSPLRAMQQAVATHWRAAAWFLERAYPHRFARRDPSHFGPKQARRLLNEILEIIADEFPGHRRERIERRLRAAFEYNIRDACDRRRTEQDFRTAMQYFAEKDRLKNPLDQFGFPKVDLDSLLRDQPAMRSTAPNPQPPASNPTAESPSPSSGLDRAAFAELTAVLKRELARSSRRRHRPAPPQVSTVPEPSSDEGGNQPSSPVPNNP
jgi:hypothetical protein